MIFRFFIAFLFMACLFAARAQETIAGKVTDKQSGKPVAGASVYIPNTSLGCISNEDGTFNLKNVPDQPFDLIVSIVGYEMLSQHFMSAKIPYQNIQLQPKVNELESVIIDSYEKDGWKHWGKFFLDNFIGTSINAVDCHILNYKSIRFRMSQKEHVLRAYAMEPLIIENKALGYRIRYDLEQWMYNFTNRELFYNGYSLFENMEGNKKELALWNDRRKDAYEISLMYFLRSIFYNKIKAAGFEIRRLQRIPNKEKERVKPLYAQYLRGTAHDKILSAVMNENKSSLPADTLAYYVRVLSQPDAQDVLYTALLPIDSIVQKTDNGIQLFCKDILYITIPGKQEEYDYGRGQLLTHRDSCVTAKLVFVNPEPVAIYSNGNFYPSQNLATDGYWAYSEHICNMLPLDYEPTDLESKK
ncbi:MAG: carboxypeptidase-like regulatory domain-containing protein [Chitinophagaceae bacterium]|jgi:hypothetical protein|nr:carboxypeptidase-like regulatory domain-containing protein [Chitinophagaceae bacterium]